MAEMKKGFNKFLIIWFGQFLASIGSGLTAFSLGVYVFQTTGSAAAVSLTTLFAFLPTILLNPVGGVLSDRFDRRLMMICGDLFSAIGLVYMLICFRSGGLGTLQIYIGVTISAIFVALMEPAYKATVTDLLPQEEFSRASGLMQLAASSKYLLSPVLGGFLLTVTDIGTIFLIDISTLVTTVLVVAFIRKTLPAKARQEGRLQLLSDLREGWQVVTGDKGVLTIVILISAATFCMGILQTLLPPMVLSFTDSKALGMVETISATGMLLGSLIIGIMPLKRYASTLATGFALAGVFMAFMGATTRLVLITAAGFLFFCTLPYINTSADVMVRCRIPDELQGRAWGLISILSQLGYVLAYACAGVLADKVFNPMLLEGGLLARTVGRLIGMGAGRGIGFMLMVSGVLVVILGLSMRRMKTVQAMEPVVEKRSGDQVPMRQKQPGRERSPKTVSITGTMLKKDFVRNKAIHMVLLLFIVLSAFLMASGSIIIANSFGAIDSLFEIAKPPHFMQMHTGEIDQEAIEDFARSVGYVTAQETFEMINIDGASICFVKEREGRTERVSLSDSMLDNGFVVQSRRFDYLLDLNNGIIRVSPGEAAVPIKYMKSYDLKRGDRLILSEGSFYREFMITDFVRDAQMASSLASSTRFLVSAEDFAAIKDNIGRLEYLIGFRLEHIDQIDGFQRLYEESGLPRNGTAVTYPLFRMVNAIGEGMKAVIFILVSLLLIFIAVITLRFTILAALEDEIREIGTMKAIGLCNRDIRRLYQSKYAILSVIGCAIGFLAALLGSGWLTADMALSYGERELAWGDIILSVASVVLVYLIIISFCKRVLRRIRDISPVQALTGQDAGSGRKKRRKASVGNVLPLHRNRILPVNLFLSIRDLVVNVRAWLLLVLVSALAVCIMVIPANLYNTFRSPSFAAYMGTAISDIRIDLQFVENLSRKHETIVERLAADQQIQRYRIYATCLYEARGEEGWQDIQVECGDYTDLRASFLEGRGPEQAGEIALSAMNARKYSVGVGDHLQLRIAGSEISYRVCGIYQDVTNGGYTAKMIYPYDREDVLKYTYFVDAAEGILPDAKAAELAEELTFAKVIPMEDYLYQTFDVVLGPLSQAAMAAKVAAVSITLLITVLFLKLNTAREYAQIANMKAMGFPSWDIRLQYIAKTGIMTAIGVLVGMLVSNILGENMVGALLSMAGFGLSRIEFVIRTPEIWVLYPLLVMMTALTAAWMCSAAVKRYNIVRLIRE